MRREQIVERNTLVNGIPFGELITKYMTRPEWVKSMPLVPGAREGFAELQKLGQILIATSIPAEAEEPRREWLQTHFNYDGQIINTMRQGKAEIQADVMIDDYPKNLEAFISASPKRRGVLMLRPSNQSYARTNHDSRISAASDWKQVLTIVNQFLNE